MRSIWANGCDVRRYPRNRFVPILGEHEVFAVRRPVLFGSDVEFKRCDLEHLSALRFEVKRTAPAGSSIQRNEAEPLAIGRDGRIDATCANTVPVVPVEIHAPVRRVVGCRIETIEHDARTVGREGGIALTHSWVWKLHQVTAVGLDDRYVGAFAGASCSKTIRRPSGDQSAAMALPVTEVIWRRSRPLGRP